LGLTPVDGLVSLRYCSVHLVAFSVAHCACSFHRSCESICTPRYLKQLVSCTSCLSKVSLGFSNGILSCSESGSNLVFLEKCITTDLDTSNHELWSLLHWSPPSSLVIRIFSRFVDSSKSFPVVMIAMSSTYPIASSLRSLSIISSRSAL
jgi:hypothetical protein